MRTLIHSTVLAASLAALATLPGCIVAAAAAGAAGAAYVAGDLEARLEGNPKQVVEAADSALKELEIHVESADASGIDGKVVGRTALDKKIQIIVKRDGEHASKLWIRVDTFGDESLSRRILEKIEAKL